MAHVHMFLRGLRQSDNIISVGGKTAFRTMQAEGS